MILREHFPLRLRRFRLFATLLLALTSLPAWAQKGPADPIQITGSMSFDVPFTTVVQEVKGTVTEIYNIRELMDEIVEVYAIRARKTPPEPKIGYQEGVEMLVRVITDTVAPDGWREAGGTMGSIREMGGLLIIVQSPENQAEIRSLLMRIQEALHRKELSPPVSDISGVVELLVRKAMTTQSQAAAHQVEVAELAVRKAKTAHKVEKGLRSPNASLLTDPTDQARSNLPIGTSYTVEITGSTTGSVWGNGVYTTDCSLSTAAVHSGALRAGEKGLVTVTLLPGQQSYEAATRNGITSQAWGEWKSSFVVQKTVPARPGDPRLEGRE